MMGRTFQRSMLFSIVVGVVLFVTILILCSGDRDGKTITVDDDGGNGTTADSSQDSI